jgi:hypothetical protein
LTGSSLILGLLLFIILKIKKRDNIFIFCIVIFKKRFDLGIQGGRILYEGFAVHSRGLYEKLCRRL